MIHEWKATLGLDPNKDYTPDEYKKAYRKMALKCHPDQGGSEEEFKKVSEAYEYLTGKRKARNAPPPDFGDIHFDLGDLFRGFGGFGPTGPNRRSRRAQKPPESDSEIGVGFNLSVEEIKNGKVVGVEYNKSKKCNDCNGVGGKKEITCNICNGSGMVQQTREMNGGHFIMQSPCHQCGGVGSRIEEPCGACNSDGFVVYKERMNIEVKERK
jgi:molecular chaperone DnaJ